MIQQHRKLNKIFEQQKYYLLLSNILYSLPFEKLRSLEIRNKFQHYKVRETPILRPVILAPKVVQGKTNSSQIFLNLIKKSKGVRFWRKKMPFLAITSQQVLSWFVINLIPTLPLLTNSTQVKNTYSKSDIFYNVKIRLFNFLLFVTS